MEDQAALLINDILGSIPAIDRFLTVDELDASSNDLAIKNPDIVRSVEIGQSTDGHPIRMLRIGNGEEQLLFFACPHPNEPIGAMALEVLAKLLIEREELRGTKYTWNLIKCIDPDGTKLNEGWFSGPFTVTNYASNFFRPGSTAQAEWAFPVTYKTYSFLRPINETKALMTAITGLRPRFIYSLHNAGMGGGYFYLTPHRPELDDALRKLVTDRGIPLSLGEPEMPWGVKLSPAIYKTPTMRDQYEFMAKQTGKDPAAMLKTGEGSYGFAMDICNPAHLMCEVPYFFDARTADTTQANGTRREAIIEGLNRTQPMIELLSATMEQVREKLTVRNRLREASLEIAPMLEQSLAMKRKWATDSPGLDTPATVAQVFDSTIAFRFYRLLFVGMAKRTLEVQLADSADSEIRDALERIRESFGKWTQELESELNYHAIPIADLVQIQLGAAFHMISAL